MFDNYGRESRLTLHAVLLACTLTVLVSPFANAVLAQGCVPLPPYASEADRIGINVVTDYGKSVYDYDTDYFGAGWFLDYHAAPRTSVSSSASVSKESSTETVAPAIANHYQLLLPYVSDNSDAPLFDNRMAYAHVLRASELDGNWEAFLTKVVKLYPGALWIVGNEPDRDLQDGMTPQAYATLYHSIYAFIKQLDATSQIAIAGVVQPTPLRRLYLDAVLDSYQQQFGAKMPIDAWTVHGFILRESSTGVPEEDWGAGIPPGMEAYKDVGIKYDVPDHGDFEEFKKNLIEFRQWMADRGYRQSPLLLTEYGILFDPTYDAPNGQTYDETFVSGFMLDSFEFMRTATDANTGFSADGNRLVQAWSWFSLNSYVYSYPDRQDGFNGNFVDHDTGEIQQLGHDFANYTAKYALDYSDLAFRSAALETSTVKANVADVEVNMFVSVYNRGNVDVPNSHVRVWLGASDSGQLLAAYPIASTLALRCSNSYDMSIAAKLPALSPGVHQITLELVGYGTTADPVAANNTVTLKLTADP